MTQYVIRRLLLSVVILFGVSIMIYCIIRALPNDFIDKTMGASPNMTAARLEELKDLYGLNKGVVEGYVNWFSGIIKGDLGESFLYKRPVADVIGEFMWTSFAIAFTAFVLQALIAIPLGIIAATKQYQLPDYVVSVFALIGISLPGFFFAGILRRLFAINPAILPFDGLISARDYDLLTPMGQLMDKAWHLVLPVSVLTVIGVGSLMRFTRTNMLEVLNSDYIRTARAKGLAESKVIYKHAFSNTLIPIVTLLGGTLPTLFAGAIITENVFSIPGLGLTAFKALNAGDIPFIMGFNMFLAFLTVLGTLIADILYAVVDPRVKLG